MLFLISVTVVLSCSISHRATQLNNSNSSGLAEIEGVYRGTIPCADCEGIKMEVILDENGKYNVSRVYLGKKGGRFNDSGKYRFDNASDKIILTDKNGKLEGLFLYTKEGIVMLNMEGSRIEGDLAEMYLLEKAPEYELTVFDPGFEYWLNSNPISIDSYSNDYLRSKNMRYSQEWNRMYLRGDRRFESYVDYDPSTRYNKDFNYKLFMYFRYFEETNRIKLL